ncbi:hypothetical protein Glove_564g63 [Diversispora epigaea]|uniref:SAM domain-containing protein n=1 Tax=Diversispora epigaea TaxID=1348612 RepID=A0A397GCU0_9GLOM|nr:hypothetical protein Glove_564g63 [Diversispora epigaea]
MSIPSVEVVSKWKRAHVLDYLNSKKDELDLDAKHIQVIEDQEIAGSGFLELNAEKLMQVGLKLRPAVAIAKLVKEIKGEEQECERKRKAKEELTNTAPNKRKWIVNSAITREERPIYYYVDPTEQNRPLFELIRRGEFVALHGPRASGKSTRVLQLQDQLNKKGFVCIYASFEHVEVTEDKNKFWMTLGTALFRNARENEISILEINSAEDFLKAFQRDQWEKRNIVLLFDKFDELYSATDAVLSSCLKTLRGIKGDKGAFAIHSVVAIGPFSILYLNPSELNTSPFNVKEPLQTPNFTLEQTQALYKAFMEEERITIDPEVIDDIYMQTNGHAGLVCLCGRAIYRRLMKKFVKGHLNYDTWQHFTIHFLGDEILDYSTFIRMKDTLLKGDTDTNNAVKFIQSDFLVNNDPVYVVETKRHLAKFLTAEGVLVSGKNSGTFKISSPLVHWLVFQRIIPQVFPTSPKVEVPRHSTTGALDILNALKLVVCVFDQETIKSCNSFKLAHVLVDNVNNRKVPRESVYDVELYRIMSNWLRRFTVTGQWHLKYRASGHNNYKYVDIVISKSDHPTIVFELLATATKKELKEHYERALLYNKKLSADETWIIHFTCEENAISKPCWPTDTQLRKGLRVIFFWHNLDFTKIKIITCWWDVNNNTKYISDVEELMV